MDVDPQAPVHESGEIVIDARPDVVWETLVDLRSWPSWMPRVKAMNVIGPIEVGAVFKWKAGPGTIRSEILEFDPPRSVGWKGRTFGITAPHAWHIENADDGTRVYTEESWAGFLARLFRRSLSKTVKTSLDDGLVALKTEPESRARSSP